MDEKKYFDTEYQKPIEFNFIESWCKPPVIHLPITLVLSYRGSGKEYYERMKKKNDSNR